MKLNNIAMKLNTIVKKLVAKFSSILHKGVKAFSYMKKITCAFSFVKTLLKQLRSIKKPTGAFSFRNTKIQTRLIASFVILLFVPILVTGLLSYYNSSKAIKEKISSSSVETAKQTANSIFMQMDRYKNYCDDIALSRGIQDLINFKTKEKSEQDSTNYTIGNDVLGPILAKLNDVQDVYISTGDTNIHWGSALSDAKMKLIDELDKQSAQKDGNAVWAVSGFKNEINTLMINRALKSMDTGDYFGFLTMSFNEKFFEQILNSNDKTQNNIFKIFVVNSQGAIVADGNVKNSGKAYEDKRLIEQLKAKEIENAKAKEKQLFFNIKLNKTDYLLTYYPVKDIDWFVVNTIPTSYLNAETTKIRNFNLILSFICLILAIGFSFVIARSISIPLKKVVESMQQAKNGDLNLIIEDNHKDEISSVSQNFTDMISNIKGLVSKVRYSSDSILDHAGKITGAAESSYLSCEQIAETVENIAKGSTDQAEQAYNSVEYMNDLLMGINKLESNVSKVSEVVHNTKSVSENTLISFKSLKDKSVNTNSIFDKIFNSIHTLNTEVKEIIKITRIITGIADQTKLLSFNASIEAAKAQASGKGFAVVAQEIKNLSVQSKEASATINKLINNILLKTQTTFELVEEASAILQEEAKAVLVTDSAFKTIYTSMEDVMQYMETTLESVQEMLVSKEKTLASIESISAVSQEAAATTEEVTAVAHEQMKSAMELKDSAKDLNDMAQSLDKSIALFKID